MICGIDTWKGSCRLCNNCIHIPPLVNLVHPFQSQSYIELQIRTQRPIHHQFYNSGHCTPCVVGESLFAVVILDLVAAQEQGPTTYMS